MSRIFVERIVGADDDEVGQVSRHPTHRRAVGRIALASVAEDDHQLSRGVWAQRQQGVLKRLGRVREVDDDQERLTAVDPLHPAVDWRQLGRGGRDVLGRGAQLERDRRRREPVQDIEPAQQSGGHRDLAARGDQHEPSTARVPGERRVPRRRPRPTGPKLTTGAPGTAPGSPARPDRPN